MTEDPDLPPQPRAYPDPGSRPDEPGARHHRGARPLDRVPSLKLKLGAVIVAAITVTAIVIALGRAHGLPLPVATVGAVLVGLLMVQLLARGMTSPLREMARAAAAMAAGDHAVRVRATSRDEVGQLAAAFNRMSAELAEVDRMRRDLVANVSHELRTPIGALQAALENLVDAVEEPDPALFAAMLAQVQRLGRLVEQLLDLSRLESGATPLNVRPFALGPVLEEAIQEARLLDARVALRLRVVPEDLTVAGDPERIHQVVANLLVNALRHSPPQGLVELAASSVDGKVRVCVEDQGPGIPEGELTRIFERFYRADAARSRDRGGSGLGLSIARWIVELHGGQIRVENREPRGCRVLVDLPRRTVPRSTA